MMTATGHAVVAATYEAYAINLNHKPRPGVVPVDEMTHYTNFPFDRIVRYKNSYFGVAADGLYLLEGTTDHAEPTPTPIPWLWKTGLTDFRTPQKKTVESMYFGGRLGPAASVSLHAGDGAQAAGLEALHEAGQSAFVLRQHLEAAFVGHGSLVLISGEAGAGKTSLAEALPNDTPSSAVTSEPIDPVEPASDGEEEPHAS